MLVLTAGLGNINASVMLFPLLMTASTAFANAINIIVFPLIIMSAILSIVNHMSETIKVDKMAKFFYEMARITLGFFLTLFVRQFHHPEQSTGRGLGENHHYETESFVHIGSCLATPSAIHADG